MIKTDGKWTIILSKNEINRLTIEKKVVNERRTNEMKTSQTRPSLVAPYLSAGKILNLFCGSKSAGLSFSYILKQ